MKERLGTAEDLAKLPFIVIGKPGFPARPEDDRSANFVGPAPPVAPKEEKKP